MSADHDMPFRVALRPWFWPAVTAIGWVSVRVFRRRPPEWLCSLVVKRAVYVVYR